MKIKLIGIALVAVTAAAVTFYPAVRSAAVGGTPPAGQAQGAQKIEVVFVLDTTSSMTGLIETAKEKIWSIATTMARAEQAPEIRMGLVAYRDRGDEYVTRVVDLSTDLDSMYATLMQFAAVGGGDGPESVNEALDGAINAISWSQDSSSYRVVFLVGDAPPHMDYFGERRYPEILRDAVAKGIVVNTIQCGELQQTIGPWTEIARLGGGRYMKVGQAGDAFAVATPFDAELAELSAELDRTRLFYGSDEERAQRLEEVVVTGSIIAAAPEAAQAGRAMYFNSTAAGAASLFADKDLVEDVTSGRVDLQELPATELPEPLRALDSAERAAEVAAIAGKRAELRERIDALGTSRAAYIEEKVAEAGGADDSLDRKIYEAVSDQAAAKGLTYEAGPAF